MTVGHTITSISIIVKPGGATTAASKKDRMGTIGTFPKHP
jgi:hypothetical protein